MWKDIIYNTGERKTFKGIISVFLQYKNPSRKSDEVTVQVNFMKFQHIVCVCVCVCVFFWGLCNGDWMG
jgi:hypothetical protein